MLTGSLFQAWLFSVALCACCFADVIRGDSQMATTRFPAFGGLKGAEKVVKYQDAGSFTLCSDVLEPLKASLAKGGTPRLTAALPDQDVHYTQPITPDHFYQLQKSMPASDSLANVSHPTCAVVGPSGSLLLHKWGDEIDSASAVFRFNAAPAAMLPMDLQRHAGSKTTYRFVRPAYNTTCEGNETRILVPNGPQVSQLVEYDEKPHSLFLLTHTPPPTQDIDDLLRGQKRRRRRGGYDAISPSFLTHVASVTGHTPSMAMLAIMLAGHICDKIKVYGLAQMEQNGVRWHYYDNAMAPVWTAALAAEQAFWQVLERSGALNFQMLLQGTCLSECNTSLRECSSCWGLSPLELLMKQKLKSEHSAVLDKVLESLDPTLKQAAKDAALASAKSVTTEASWGWAINTNAIDDMTMEQLRSYFTSQNHPAPDTRVEMVEAIRADHASRLGTFLNAQQTVYLSQEERGDLQIHHVRDPQKQWRW